MKIGVYAVRDAKTEAFSAPLFFITPAVAVRAFGDECNNSESPWHRHPEDYALFLLGTFDDNSGLIESQQPTQITSALDFHRD